MDVHSDARVEMIAKIFKTLSDTNRLRIIKAFTMNCQSVSAIVKATEMSQPLVSHHLSVLRKTGLARAERHGAYTYY